MHPAQRPYRTGSRRPVRAYPQPSRQPALRARPHSGGGRLRHRPRSLFGHRTTSRHGWPPTWCGSRTASWPSIGTYSRTRRPEPIEERIAHVRRPLPRMTQTGESRGRTAIRSGQPSGPSTWSGQTAAHVVRAGAPSCATTFRKSRPWICSLSPPSASSCSTLWSLSGWIGVSLSGSM